MQSRKGRYQIAVDYFKPLIKEPYKNNQCNTQQLYIDKQISYEEKEKKSDYNVVYEIPEERSDIFILTKGIPIPAELVEETKKKAKD